MNLQEKSKATLAILIVLFVSGCADYQNHNDSVTLGVGNAPEANLAIHTIKPFPEVAGKTDINVSGKTTENALDRYEQPGDPAVVGDRAATVSIPIPN